MKVAIASGKGGTGKTTIATNLAAYLADTEDVVIVDLDVEEPNTALFLDGPVILEEVKYKMIPQWSEADCTLCGLCTDVCNFNALIQIVSQILVFPELCHSCYACSELCPAGALPMIKRSMGTLSVFSTGRLTLVESRLEIGQEQAVPLISQTKDYVSKNFPDNMVQIFDSPPGTSCPVIEATKDAGLVLLVTEPTPFGLHDLILAYETMQVLDKNCAVILNRDGIGDNGVIDFCSEKGIPVVAKIPNSREIATLYSKGELIYRKVPEFRIELEKIKRYINTINEQLTG